MQAYVQRIESINPHFNALVSLQDPAMLLAQAHACDADLAHACALLRTHRAIDDTLDRARHYGQRAIDAIAHFPAGEAKSALTEAVEFAIARAY
jgi:geranylgeranyl pyrophosphate synthase